MLEYTEDLVSGMKVILSLFPNARGVFAVEDNKKDCIEKLQKAVAGAVLLDAACNIGVDAVYTAFGIVVIRRIGTFCV